MPSCLSGWMDGVTHLKDGCPQVPGTTCYQDNDLFIAIRSNESDVDTGGRYFGPLGPISERALTHRLLPYPSTWRLQVRSNILLLRESVATLSILLCSHLTKLKRSTVHRQGYEYDSETPANCCC